MVIGIFLFILDNYYNFSRVIFLRSKSNIFTKFSHVFWEDTVNNINFIHNRILIVAVNEI